MNALWINSPHSVLHTVILYNRIYSFHWLEEYYFQRKEPSLNDLSKNLLRSSSFAYKITRWNSYIYVIYPILELIIYFIVIEILSFSELSKWIKKSKILKQRRKILWSRMLAMASFSCLLQQSLVWGKKKRQTPPASLKAWHIHQNNN